jgi:uncharacterized repeat protein (TIGR02543 family)
VNLAPDNGQAGVAATVYEISLAAQDFAGNETKLLLQVSASGSAQTGPLQLLLDTNAGNILSTGMSGVQLLSGLVVAPSFSVHSIATNTVSSLTSDNPGVVSVNGATGAITISGVGTASISGTYGNLNAELHLTVVDKLPLGVAIDIISNESVSLLLPPLPGFSGALNIIGTGLTPQSITSGFDQQQIIVIDNLTPHTDYVISFSHGSTAYEQATLFVTTTTQFQFQIAYNANSGSGIMASDSVARGEAYMIKPNTFTRSGYSFTGWNTAANGSGADYAAGAAISSVQSDITLYAQWSFTGSGNGAGSGGGYTSINPSGIFRGGSVYRHGSSTGLVFIVEKAFSQFVSVRVNNITIVGDKDYKAEESSTKITLFPEYLDTLESGTHILTVSFRDGTHTTSNFTVTDTDAPIIITPEKPVNPFTDVRGTDWFFDAVVYVNHYGLMIGTSTDPMLFSPNLTLTRGMVVTVLYRIEGSPDVSGLANPFNDLIDGAWYADAVKWAYHNGIVSGYGGGKFGPNDDITRQDMAVMLNNYANFAGKELPKIRGYPGFLDEADIANYAKEAVERFFMAAIINGKPGNVFDPRGQATRAEFATMLMNFAETIGQV